MIWFIIPLIIFIIIGIREEFDWALWILGGLISLFIGLMAVLTIGSVIGQYLPTTTIETQTPIIALQDNVVASGSFFLGTGTIDGDLFYFVMTEEEQGFIVKKLEASETFLRYAEGEPILIENKKILTNENFYWVSIRIPSYKYIIEIPEGSILTNFTVDMK